MEVAVAESREATAAPNHTGKIKIVWEAWVFFPGERSRLGRELTPPLGTANRASGSRWGKFPEQGIFTWIDPIPADPNKNFRDRPHRD